MRKIWLPIMITSALVTLVPSSVSPNQVPELPAARACRECYMDLAEFFTPTRQSCIDAAPFILQCMQVCAIDQNRPAADDLAGLSQQCIQLLRPVPAPWVNSVVSVGQGDDEIFPRPPLRPQLQPRR